MHDYRHAALSTVPYTKCALNVLFPSLAGLSYPYCDGLKIWFQLIACNSHISIPIAADGFPVTM